MPPELIKLYWDLLEYKLMYYEPFFVHPDWYEELTISDGLYDALELKVKATGKEIPVGFPDTASGRLVRSKLRLSKKELNELIKSLKGALND